MYVDEGGDSGLTNSPTRYFVLTGLVLHELRWRPYLDQLISFRQRIKAAHGLKLREEIHAAALLNKPGNLVHIPRNDRLAILRDFAGELGTMPDLNIINIVVDKQGKTPTYDVFGMAWKALIQRLRTRSRTITLPARPTRMMGDGVPDHTEDKKLTQLLRAMRQYNPITNQSQFAAGYRNLALGNILEDPNFRNSATRIGCRRRTWPHSCSTSTLLQLVYEKEVRAKLLQSARRHPVQKSIFH